MKKYIIGFAVVLLFLTSCEDFLVKEPALEQTNELTLSTFKGITNATIGAYSPLYETNWYGRDFVMAADMMGGNAKKSPRNSGRFITEYLWTFTEAGAPGLWVDAYDAIARANNILEAIDGFEEAGVTQDEIDNVKGECLFIRAIGHFDLVRLYAQQYSSGASNPGVPVILKTEIALPARNTVGEVYTQVIADLTEAESLLSIDNKHGDSGRTKSWINKYAAQALLARVYLYQENWQKAADYASAIINSGAFTMYSAAECTTWDNNGAWGIDDASEVIFEVYGSKSNESWGSWDVIGYIVSPTGYGDVGTSHDLLNLYEAGDARINLFTTDEQYTANDYWTLKYPGKLGVSREDNIPVLRLSEMYLIRAEAQLKGASVSGSSALADYNMIRSNRGLSDATTVSLSNIYNERRRELCFEGHEFFDLARTKRGLIRVDYTGSANQNVAFPNYMWALPIPKNEIDANENVPQNDGY